MNIRIVLLIYDKQLWNKKKSSHESIFGVHHFWRRYCVGFTVLFVKGQQYTIRIENVPGTITKGRTK